MNGPWIARDHDPDYLGCSYMQDAGEIPEGATDFRSLYCGRPATHDLLSTDGFMYHVCLEHSFYAISAEMRPYLASIRLREVMPDEAP